MSESRIPNPQSRLHDDKILILDFGAQYTQLIARRVRELGVYCEIWAWDHDPAEIAAFGAKGFILSGGPESTTLADAPKAPQQVFDSSLPILGICYGMQTLAAQLGGATEAADAREFGHASVDIVAPSRLFDGLNDHPGEHKLDVWMSHGDHVSKAPPGFTVTGRTDRIPVAVMENEARRWYGVQFHPEVTHTKQGGALLKRFITEICGCATLWTAANIIDDQIARVRALVGDDHVLLGLSGGVDSSVVAALLHKAIGDRLTCVFVDTGLLRWQEGDQVMATMAEHMGVKVIRVNAADRYFHALEGVTDPETKRKIIGGLFVEIFDEESSKITAAGGKVKWLAQGTIYPDVIESAGSRTGKAHVIKSHHNVGGLPAHMKLKLVEPLRELFKDEVRRIGVELGLPRAMVYRHPFPGPGLGVRILGEVKREYAELLAKADAIFIDELRKADLYDKTSQAFAVFLPVKSVGVVGDARAYEWVIALRAVETVDFMTAHWAHLPYEFLGRVSNRIINELRGVSRVVYDISGKPPATIEWE
ncbi:MULTISPECIES: glutamine-hydrolyzing GMP synthase [Rhodanobacter]|uniref:glutamine-hydrolyzing GMP synthase n=1 Tax=Rhodanobacter TaxID=75309 RepID=UPI0004895818|nr:MULTISPECIES: glutamine-hydrolyzing GMP synthase [Rhodanobacter]KZC19738.1 glutamine-hydrolyzing GMP synthase [Rhodanobacter denitrificans]UJJ52672.1 glutamine-hydrolyzing GMP synthase [Rhodanobacter denitrificans]UJM95425.1 glutamine-hydrolyzing GMP synthase [Rhodanobacter denitrificans]UJM98956.1 glutamine-hydrolyzing GMP synthase [Rhodanobacter denitrificans]UJN21629.1 glutamine-hydrolyzing GMP synthase [Rhodanobacter denitrificans]